MSIISEGIGSVYDEGGKRIGRSSYDPLAVEDLTERNLGARGYSLVKNPEAEEIGEDSGIFVIEQKDGKVRVRVGRLQEGEGTEFPLSAKCDVPAEDVMDLPVKNGPSRRNLSDPNKWY